MNQAKDVAQVLWNAGHRTAKSMKRRGGYPRGYIKELSRGRAEPRASREKKFFVIIYIFRLNYYENNIRPNFVDLTVQ